MKFLHSLPLMLLLLIGCIWSGVAGEKTIPWEHGQLVAAEQSSDNLNFEQYYFKELFGNSLMISIIRGKSPVRYRIGVCKNGQRETVSSLARKYNAAAAVNAGFFTFDSVSRPVGILKSAGIVYNDSLAGLPNRGYLAISSKQNVRILTPAELMLDEFDSIVYGNDLRLSPRLDNILLKDWCKSL